MSQVARKAASAAFIDTKRCLVKAGGGGPGAVHFDRQPFQEVAPPDGGNGIRSIRVAFDRST